MFFRKHHKKHKNNKRVGINDEIPYGAVMRGGKKNKGFISETHMSAIRSMVLSKKRLFVYVEK